MALVMMIKIPIINRDLFPNSNVPRRDNGDAWLASNVPTGQLCQSNVAL